MTRETRIIRRIEYREMHARIMRQREQLYFMEKAVREAEGSAEYWKNTALSVMENRRWPWDEKARRANFSEVHYL